MINSLTLSASKIAPEDAAIPAKGAEMLEKSGVNFGELLTVEEGTEIRADRAAHTETDAVPLPWIEVTLPQTPTKTSLTPNKAVRIEFNLTTEGIPDAPENGPIARADTDTPTESIKSQVLADADTQSLEAAPASPRRTINQPRAELVTPPPGEALQPTRTQSSAERDKFSAPVVSRQPLSARATASTPSQPSTSNSVSVTTSPSATTPASSATARETVAIQANATAATQGTGTANPPIISEQAARNLNRQSSVDAEAPTQRTTSNRTAAPQIAQVSSSETITPLTVEPGPHDVTNSVITLETSADPSTTAPTPIDIDTAQTADPKTPVMRDAPTPEQKLAMAEEAPAPKVDIATPVSSALASTTSIDTPDATTTISPSVSAAAPTSTGPALTVAAPTQAPAPLPAMPPQAVVGVVAERLINEPDNSDRIVVQLDPPELGRVAIDFKFDAQGLQTVTITGESPEALKQLRLMHFELVQALEEHGLSGSDLTFEQSTSQQSQQNPSSFAEASSQDIVAEPDFSEPQATRPTNYAKADSGLDLKL